MDEELTKALHSATFATQELQQALKTADAVAALVLLPMIADAARLAQQISGLIHARAGEAEAGCAVLKCPNHQISGAVR